MLMQRPNNADRGFRPLSKRGKSLVSTSVEESSCLDIDKWSGPPAKTLLLMALIVGLVSSSAAFAGGSGTSSDPYEISTCQQLQDMNTDLDAYYELVNDIDCSGTSSWNSQKGFDPVGIFDGNLDGNNYVINDLYIDRPGESPVGLFYQLDGGGTITNIGLKNVTVTGDSEVGGLVGANFGYINKSFVSGKITGKDRQAGVLVGYNYNGDNISNSYSFGSADAVYQVGGLVGRNDGAVYTSYSTATPSADDLVGGLIGFESGGLVNDSYWDTEESGQDSSYGGTNLTTSEMIGGSATSNMNFDYSTIWETVKASDSDVGSDGYPILQSLDRSEQLDLVVNEPPVLDSTGVSPDPFYIGDSLSYSASASDSDGTVENISLTVFQNGSQVYSNTVSSSSNTWGDVHVAQEGSVDARFVATDNEGGSTTEWINKTLSDSSPANPSINLPDSSTKNEETISYDLSISSDGDDKLNEQVDVVLKEDGSQVGSHTVITGRVSGSYTTSGEGSHTFTADVVETDDGQSSSSSVSYSVDFISPTVDSISFNPSTIEYDDGPDVTVDASDNTEVSEVCVSVDKDGSGFVGQQCRSTSSASVTETFSDLFTVDETDSTYTVDVTVTDNQGKTGTDSTSQTVSNSAPAVSISNDPNSWRFGDSPDIDYSVSDSNGDVQSREMRVYEAGSLIQSYSLSSNSGTVSDAFTVDEKNVDYKVEVEAVDTSTSTVQSISDTITDNFGTVSVSGVQNKTYWTYDVPLEVTHSDSDDVPDEDITCSFTNNSVQYDQHVFTENQTYSDILGSDLGSYSPSWECVDEGGNTATGTLPDYSVKASKLERVYGASPVYETENRSFELDLKTGDMVNSADVDFVYDGSTKGSNSLISDGVETLRPDFYHEVPLVSSNQTTKNWEINYDLNISDFQASTTSTITESTSSQTHEVLWSYYLENSDTDPADGKYIETEDFKHDVKVHTETKNADLEGTTTYNRNNEETSMNTFVNATDYTTLRGVIDVGLADSFNKSSFTTESSVQVSFNGESRTLTTGTDTVKVYKIKITDGSTSLNTSEALKFDVDYEEEGYDTETKLTMDLSLWKNRDEKIRRYQFKKDAAQTHSFNIYPAWAEYKIRTLPYPDKKKFDLIQYFNQETDKVRRSYFFPTFQTINNQTTTVPLKTINESETTAIDFEITNSDGDPAKDIYCRVDRKFGGGDFETVFMIKTGGEGKSQSFAEVDEIYYGFTCYQNGQIADEFSAQIMQNPMRLQLGGETVPTSLNYNSRFDASCTSNTTRLNCDYQSDTEKLQEARLTVERNEVKQDVQVCEKTSLTATGRLVCNGLNTTENSYNYQVVGQFPDATVTGQTGFLGTQGQPIPGAALFMTAILFMLTTAATAFDLRVGIASGALVFILSSMINWIVLNPSQQATLIGMAIIAGVAVSQ